MPRVIKLRALDRNDGKVKPVARVDLENELVLFVDESGWVDFDNAELMQYTGLKDKHGKEIYEGNKLKGDDEYSFYVVVYSNKKAMFMLDYYEYPGAEPIKYEYAMDDFTDHEIVGNIYES